MFAVHPLASTSLRARSASQRSMILTKRYRCQPFVATQMRDIVKQHFLFKSALFDSCACLASSARSVPALGAHDMMVMSRSETPETGEPKP